MGHRCGVRRRPRLATWAVVVVAAGAVLGSGGVCLPADTDEADGSHPHGHPIELDGAGENGHPASLPCSASACAAATIVIATAATRGLGTSWGLGGIASTRFGEAPAGPEPPVPRTLRRT
jgi:hypothetical protein